MRPARPLHPDLVIDDIVGALRLDAIALAVLDREIAQHDMIRGNQQPLARPQLPGEIEHGLVHARAADGDMVDIERQAVDQIKATGAQLHDIPRLGQDQRFLKPFLGIASGIDGDGFGKGRSAQAKRGGNQQSADHISLLQEREIMPQNHADAKSIDMDVNRSGCSAISRLTESIPPPRRRESRYCRRSAGYWPWCRRSGQARCRPAPPPQSPAWQYW